MFKRRYINFLFPMKKRKIELPSTFYVYSYFINILSASFCIPCNLSLYAVYFHSKLQTSSLDRLEDNPDGEKYGVDSSGESVYSSAKEFDEDCDTVFYTAIGCPSSSPKQSLSIKPIIPVNHSSSRCYEAGNFQSN